MCEANNGQGCSVDDRRGDGGQQRSDARQVELARGELYSLSAGHQASFYGAPMSLGLAEDVAALSRQRADIQCRTVGFVVGVGLRLQTRVYARVDGYSSSPEQRAGLWHETERGRFALRSGDFLSARSRPLRQLALIRSNQAECLMGALSVSTSNGGGCNHVLARGGSGFGKRRRPRRGLQCALQRAPRIVSQLAVLTFAMGKPAPAQVACSNGKAPAQRREHQFP